MLSGRTDVSSEPLFPEDVAQDIQRISKFAVSRYAKTERFRWSDIDDLVSETCLEILERGARQPGRKFYPGALIRFAMGDAARRLLALDGVTRYSGRIAYAQPLSEYLGGSGRELSVPPDVLIKEALVERLKEEQASDETHEQVVEWASLPLEERQSRILEACRATGTTPVLA